MSILKILKYPNKNLRIKANIVKKIDNNIFKIVKNMFDTMYHYKGIGLSATQVNIHKQIIIIDINNNKFILINPKIYKKYNFTMSNEGCLSIPNFFKNIIRYKNISVSALDINGNKFKLNAKNLLSSCIQHEIDHLLGILIKDYV